MTPDPDSERGGAVELRPGRAAELEQRKRRLGILGFDDLLSRLATALEPGPDGAPHPRPPGWPRAGAIVMVDEFQDTDPVQWQVIERAFGGRATVILIGDPKQAIYAFRGGDIVTYLEAARTAEHRRTLEVNWRSDAVLVDSLQTVLRGAALGHEDIVVRDVEPRHHGHRLAGAPNNAPFRLRVVGREKFRTPQHKTISIGPIAQAHRGDLAADIGALLASGATFDGQPDQGGRYRDHRRETPRRPRLP